MDMLFTDPYGLDGPTVASRDAAGQGFPDVIVTRRAASVTEAPDDLSFEELAGAPPRRLPHEDERAWLVRALFDLGQDPIDMDFMSDGELRNLFRELSSGVGE
jgi:hypothetical protein